MPTFQCTTGPGGGDHPTRGRILRAIRAHVRRHGRPPTLRELAASADLASTEAVRYHLRVLAHRGAVALEPRTARGIRLADAIVRTVDAPPACAECARLDAELARLQARVDALTRAG